MPKHVEPFHYWGWIEDADGFIGPVGKNDSKFDGEQYTGFKDNNGKDIYVGDLISEYRGVVVYFNGAFRVEHDHGEKRQTTLLQKWLFKRKKAKIGIVVIGNIHEDISNGE